MATTGMTGSGSTWTPSLQLPLCSTMVGITTDAMFPELFGTGLQPGAPGSKTSQHPECSVPAQHAESSGCRIGGLQWKWPLPPWIKLAGKITTHEMTLVNELGCQLAQVCKHYRGPKKNWVRGVVRTSVTSSAQVAAMRAQLLGCSLACNSSLAHLIRD